MSSEMKTNPPSNPFGELSALRSDQPFADTAGMKNALITVPVLGPNRHDFFGVRPAYGRQVSERRIAYRRFDVNAWLTARTTDRIGRIEVQQRVSPQPFTPNGEPA
jgi:hypothetical protein